MQTEIHTSRMNIAFPDTMLMEFKELIPARKRNQFIVHLVEKELRRLRMLKAFEETSGAWLLEDHPELATDEDIDKYVRTMRGSAMPRTWDQLAAEGEENV